MSAIWSLTGAKRTWQGKLVSVAIGFGNSLIDPDRALEFHRMHNFIAVERVLRRCRRVGENISFDFAFQLISR